MNQTPQTPDLVDVLDLLKENILKSMNCCAIATIESFNPDNQTVTASINYQKTTYTGQNGNIPQYENYPILIDCPAIILTGGSASLTLPIQAGDTCLMLFNDRQIDLWFQDGTVKPLSIPRFHSFADGIALVGLRSLKNVLANYDTTRAVLQHGEAKVGVGVSLIKLSNNVTTLLTLLNGLIDIIKTAYTIPTVPGNPATLDPAVIAQLELYKTTLGGLLE